MLSYVTVQDTGALNGKTSWICSVVNNSYLKLHGHPISHSHFIIISQGYVFHVTDILSYLCFCYTWPYLYFSYVWSCRKLPFWWKVLQNNYSNCFGPDFSLLVPVPQLKEKGAHNVKPKLKTMKSIKAQSPQKRF